MKSSRDGRSERVNTILLLVLLVCASALIIERLAFDDRPMNAWDYFSVAVWGFLALNAAYRLITGRSGNGAARN